MIQDKITNNAYTNGELDFREFTSPITLHSGVASLYEEYSLDATDYKVKKQLENSLYEIFVNSEYYEKYSSYRKIDKNDLLVMYYYFKEILLLEHTFSSIDIFMGFAEFFEINYDILYAKISVLDKENILKEMEEMVSVKSRVKSKKLF